MVKPGLLFLMLGIGAFAVSQWAETSSAARPVAVVIRTDHEKYSLADTVKLDVSLQNTSDATVYVDRRIFCCGIGSGLELQVRDAQGKRVPLHTIEEIMPPPKEGDTSILVPLDSGFFYGTWLDLPVKNAFPIGGAWTQEHLASAIKQIEKQPRFTIPVKDLSPVDTSISCESYTDPQRKGGEKQGRSFL
jgi:hypothetical protein